MNIGKLRRIVTVEKVTLTSDGRGGTTATWATEKKTFAKVQVLESAQSKRLFEGGEQFQGTAYEIIMRWDSVSITDIGTFRILYGTKTLTIHSITNLKEDSNYQRVIAVDA